MVVVVVANDGCTRTVDVVGFSGRCGMLRCTVVLGGGVGSGKRYCSRWWWW